jgi:hypothetical protein
VCFLGFEQHSISIFAVNLDVTDTDKVSSARIALTLGVSMSRNLVLFAESAATRRQQMCAILSAVTGIAVANIQIQALAPPGIIATVFDIVISIPHYRSPYQEQRVRRLTSNFARPGTSVRNRVESMFLQLIETWLPDYTPGNVIELLGASVHFPGDIPKTPLRSRRLFQTSIKPPAPSRDSTHQSPAVPSWNQTSSFFLRSYTTTDNSDSMLAFSSAGGLFSRMCVVTIRYSLSSYCSQNEKTNLQAIQDRLADPLRAASSGLIHQTIAVALAPAHTLFCETSPSTGSPLLSVNSRRNDASSDSSILLRVEIIVYTNTTGTFVLTANRELSDIGVEHISITATKKYMHEVDFTLDTVGFRHDGSLVVAGAEILELPLRHISTTILIAILGGAVLLLSGVAYVAYQHQLHARQKDATTTNAESTVQYSALNVTAGGCSCSLHYNSHAGSGTSLNVVSQESYAANPTYHSIVIGDDNYAAWRGRLV